MVESLPTAQGEEMPFLQVKRCSECRAPYAVVPDVPTLCPYCAWNKYNAWFEIDILGTADATTVENFLDSIEGVRYE